MLLDLPAKVEAARVVVCVSPASDSGSGSFSLMAIGGLIRVTPDSVVEGQPLPSASTVLARRFSCCTGTSGVVPDTGAAAVVGYSSVSCRRKKKDLIVF
jgi:hypothetical protein